MFSHSIYGGNQKLWLVAFYGYGQSATVFEALYDKIKSTHNILVIDNPMQDYSRDIHPEDLKKYLSECFSRLGISTFQTVSYSMGSRLNLYMPLFFKNQLKRIIIAAPDGIKFNFWNRVAISTPWGRWLFKYFVENGPIYMKVLKFLNSIGIVNKSMYAFSKWNMRDDKRRKNVYNAWMNMRYLRPNLNEVNNIIEENKIAMTTYFGKNDPVIPIALQERCEKYFPTASHVLLDADHNLLKDELFILVANEIT